MVIGVESVLDVIIHHYLDRFKYIDALASPSLRWKCYPTIFLSSYTLIFKAK